MYSRCQQHSSSNSDRSRLVVWRRDSGGIYSSFMSNYQLVISFI
jgi:hypothetical protein